MGGVLADSWALSDLRGRVWVPALAMLGSFPFTFVIFTTESRGLAIASLCAPAALGLMYQAPTFAVVQSLATPMMRATAAAVLLFVVNIIGLAVGPAAIGALSDALEPRFGEDSLRYALLCGSILLLWSGFHFWRAARSLEEDVARVREATG